MFNVKLDNLSVAYSRVGEGPALVLLHGFIIDSQIWRHQVEDLAEKFTVIAWDAPGTGESPDPPESFTLSDWAKCLAALLNALGFERAHILGLSWGGILAQEFYRLYPERVLSLILVGTYAGWKGSLPEPIPEERLASCLDDSSLPPGEFVQKYMPGMLGDSPAREIQGELRDIMSRFHPVGFRMMAITSAVTDTRELLPAVKVPTLLVWGEQDKRSPLSVAYQFRDTIPGAMLEIIPGAGHICNLEDSAFFNKIVKDFCRNVV